MAAALAAGWLGVLAGSAAAAPADDLRDAQKLYQQNKLQPALDKVDIFLRAQPRDPQGRFLKGLVLTEQKRTPEAIQVFTGLTEDFPELPEPYNNLAVLYASQGNYDKAKSALELAIHTHPSYATAHENLGDIYAQLASRAYDRALQLDKSNATAQAKLSLVKDLFSKSGGVAPVKPAAAAAVAAPPVAPKTEPVKAVAPKVEATKAAPAKVAPAPAPAPAPATLAAPEKIERVPASPDDKAQITAAIESWARAWSAKDVKGYLASYAPDFDVPKGAKRSAWERERSDRITKPKRIEVEAKVQTITVTGNEATATIRQNYRSDAIKSSNTKTLRFVKSGERWLIKQERAGG